MPADTTVQKSLGQLDALLEEVDSFTDLAARDKTLQIVQSLLEFHGQALARMLECVAQAGEAGAPILEAFAQDALISSALLVHNLHPLTLEARVRQAIEKVQPYLALHHGHVELLGITPEGVVNLRLEGSCHGCPSSQMTLKNSIEEAIYAAAPEVTAIEAEGLAPATPPANGFVPISALTNKTAYPNGCEIPSL